jgi:hypothetical protein
VKGDGRDGVGRVRAIVAWSTDSTRRYRTTRVLLRERRSNVNSPWLERPSPCKGLAS